MLILDHLASRTLTFTLAVSAALRSSSCVSVIMPDSGDSAHDGVHTGDSTLDRPLVANVVEDLNPFQFLPQIQRNLTQITRKTSAL
ncbi:hypothetical protein RB213_004322 [Colletotrichum asianum]|uniref:Uncharacterized protein n=1 Tax=Colletotrichum asianum TaxID=702518 RepID=A0A8H3WHA8_9PEZI|nr:hypothetical protein GQ607_006260 [Colletotrichum asianum]